ncbi:MAG: response regulator transcription factor [Chryseotalea sp. WA131a]|jgi:two-component system copper resistance phosphate regulon response regulator CusR|nr:MAG: response regulator transcription factor [Chryseotalea sp. WA131a]
MKILLVEDEPKLNEFIRKGLEQQGYRVDAVSNGSEALDLAATEKYDLIILDIMLPGISGFDVLENLNRFGIQVPVIITSALSSSERVVEGLDKGAIDYIKKPFEFNEFLARIRAVTRKGHGKNISRYQVGNLSMDLLSRKVFYQEEEVILTKREFSLLELLLSNCNRIISKTEMAEKVWEVNFDMGSNVIEVHLSQLRKKLGNGDFIQTKVGIGYYIEGELIKN